MWDIFYCSGWRQAWIQIQALPEYGSHEAEASMGPESNKAHPLRALHGIKTSFFFPMILGGYAGFQFFEIPTGVFMLIKHMCKIHLKKMIWSLRPSEL